MSSEAYDDYLELCLVVGGGGIAPMDLSKLNNTKGGGMIDRVVTECIVKGGHVSVGQPVIFAGTKNVYRGELMKPLTWLKFEKVQIIKPLPVDHIAIVRSL